MKHLEEENAQKTMIIAWNQIMIPVFKTYIHAWLKSVAYSSQETYIIIN
jgi:hypothetical protein